PGSPEIHVIEDFSETVRAAAQEASPGDTVLLSPACTSYDHFKNFEERGNAFRQIIMEME
ncbi:MAG: UDP-N-acetylmuramoyl-L-alanine--D-glutamate ligase, partial [Oscillospiraceae bacterium]|nr:UDP-N-acetylmuramoyl-L-alanine--D-glutamate ligase [Oscillospiraceae bacterium]